MSTFEEFIRLETESFDDIRARLEGRLFHVTSRANYEKIVADGEIRPNLSGEFDAPFGRRPNGYFQKRGCVSLFDYRETPPEEFYRHRCDVFTPARPGNGGAAMLLLEPSLESRLISWRQWKIDNVLSDMVVPYVEAGHLGPISLSLVTEVLVVTMLADENALWSGFRRALPKAT